MPRLGRWLLNVLTVLSLALATASLCVWVRSHWAGDELVWEKQTVERASMEWRRSILRWSDGDVRLDFGYSLTTGDIAKPVRRSNTFASHVGRPWPVYMTIDGPAPTF